MAAGNDKAKHGPKHAEHPAVALEVSGLKPAPFEWDDVKEGEVLRKLGKHILGKFCVLTVLNYLDRTNLAFAALQLNKELGFSETVYGIGSGVFFLSYSLFQVPSNLILLRLGGRLWLSIMLILWGCVATSFAAMNTTTTFYVLRFLLGLAECGSFPGMWYHMSLFFTSAQIGVAYASIVAAIVLSQVMGGPLAALLLSLDGVWGLSGWRWLFLLEGLPTIVFGCYLLATLADSPEQATFLTEDERKWVSSKLAADKSRSVGASVNSWDGAGNWRTWYCAAIAFQNSIAKYAILYWCPLIINSLVGAGLVARQRDWVVALLTGVPFSMAAGATILIAKNSKRTGERKRHVWVPMGCAGIALFLLPQALLQQPVVAFFLLIPATLLWANEGVFMSWPATFLQGAAAATGVAMINSIGNAGGMVGPYVMGVMKQRHGDFSSAVLLLATIVGFNTFLTAAFRLPETRPEAGHRSVSTKGNRDGGGAGAKGGRDSGGTVPRVDSKGDVRMKLITVSSKSQL